MYLLCVSTLRIIKTPQDVYLSCENHPAVRQQNFILKVLTGSGVLRHRLFSSCRYTLRPTGEKQLLYVFTYLFNSHLMFFLMH